MRLTDRLEAIARDSISRCAPGLLVEAALEGRTETSFVAGAGKAAVAMAEGAFSALGDRMIRGPIVGRDPPSPLSPLAGAFIRAGHPVVDESSVVATQHLLSFFRSRAVGEHLVFLLSGGASALIGAPLPVLSLLAWQSAHRRLLRSGLPIAAINVVRRHLGVALGGRLALATRASIEALVISDVVGDAPEDVGSGPVSPDPTRFADALRIAGAVPLSDEVLAVLQAGADGRIAETPKPGDPRFDRVRYRILASPRTLLLAAADRVRRAGLHPLVEDTLVEGDVEELARFYAARAASLLPGECVVRVGEPTVRLRGAGRGGRAQQLAGLVALGLAGDSAAFLAVGSDGSDGPTDAAGASVDGGTVSELTGRGVSLAAALEDNDAYPALEQASALIRTGATGTNLLDLHLLARAPD